MIRLSGGPSDGVELPEGCSTRRIKVPFVQKSTGERRWAVYQLHGSVDDVHTYTFVADEPRLRPA